MSANNQILIKKHKGKYLVFDNIMAESWSDKNELSAKDATGVCKTKLAALEKARHLQRQAIDEGWPIEYGIEFECLVKDGADVKII